MEWNQKNISTSVLMTPNNFHFELCNKYSKIIYGTQLYHDNYIPVPLYITELICFLIPDANERYTRFDYPERNIINHLNLWNDPIQVIIWNHNTDKFIKNYPRLFAWEISNSDNVKTLWCLCIFFNELDALIDAIHYFYNNIHDLHLVQAKKIEYPK